MAVDMTKPEPGFGLLEAHCVCAGKGDDAHIIRIKLHASGKISQPEKTFCGVKRKEKLYYIFTCKTENELRTRLEDLKNNGLNICGRCVASFY